MRPALLSLALISALSAGLWRPDVLDFLAQAGVAGRA